MTQRALRDTLTNFAGGLIGPLAALATAPILAAGLGVVGRGEVAGATAPLLLAVSLASLGLPSAVNHWVARHAGHTRRVLGLAIAASASAGTALTIAIICTSDLLAGGDRSVSHLTSLAAVALVPNLIASLLQAVAAGRHAWRLVALERLVTNGIRLAALFAAAMTGALTVDLAVVVIALTPVIGSLVYLPLLSTPAGSAPTAGARELLSYGGRVWFGALAGIVLTRVDQVLLLPLAGATALGLYAVAVSLSDIPLVVANAVREVTYSRQSAGLDHSALARASRLTSVAVGGTCVALAVVAPWIVPALFGAEFADAVPATLVLLLGCSISVPGSLAGVALAAGGRPGLRSTSIVVAAVCNLLLLVGLAGPLGVDGAALATLGGSVVANGLSLVLARWSLGIRIRDFVGLRRSDLALVRATVRRRTSRLT